MMMSFICSSLAAKVETENQLLRVMLSLLRTRHVRTLLTLLNKTALRRREEEQATWWQALMLTRRWTMKNITYMHATKGNTIMTRTSATQTRPTSLVEFHVCTMSVHLASRVTSARC